MGEKSSAKKKKKRKSTGSPFTGKAYKLPKPSWSKSTAPLSRKKNQNSKKKKKKKNAFHRNGLIKSKANKSKKRRTPKKKHHSKSGTKNIKKRQSEKSSAKKKKRKSTGSPFTGKAYKLPKPPLLNRANGGKRIQRKGESYNLPALSKAFKGYSGWFKRFIKRKAAKS